MSIWKSARLGDIVNFVGGGTPSRSNPAYYGGAIPWVTPKDVKSWSISDAQINITPAGLHGSAARLVPANSVLIVVRSGILKHTLPVGLNRVPVTMNQDMKALLPPKELNSDFLARFIKSRQREILGWVRATTADNFPVDKLKDIRVPLPPLEEQRRIADVLDRADELRIKHRQALVYLDDLTQSIFLDMFGNPQINPMQWQTTTLGATLTAPLRNGLSPSSQGKVNAKVLTLSSITGPQFDPTAYKVAPFATTPPLTQSVNSSDLLICRGNGNIKLVGRGFFPTTSMRDTTFPDTIIAARISSDRIRPAFLQHVWHSRGVRAQIESVARTTNGTYKVNQTMLENISFYSPDLDLQDAFAQRVEVAEKLKSTHRTALSKLDELFASLQDRAFRGEL